MKLDDLQNLMRGAAAMGAQHALGAARIEAKPLMIENEALDKLNRMQEQLQTLAGVSEDAACRYLKDNKLYLIHI